MSSEVIRERIRLLRTKMEEKGLKAYIVPDNDFHGSEYISDFFQGRRFFSGFTGSNGTLVVTDTEAGLWTDGRYFIQAEEQLKDTGISLRRMYEEGEDTIIQFLQKKLKKGDIVGFDGRCMDAKQGLEMEKNLAENGMEIKYNVDFLSDLWTDRPDMPCHEIWVMDENKAGKTVMEKISAVMDYLEEKRTCGFLLTKLDDIMYLLNIRGADVECNPVALSFFYMDEAKKILFIQKKEVNQATAEYFDRNGIEVRDYSDFWDFIEQYEGKDKKILLDRRYCSYGIYKILSDRAEIVEGDNPTERMKAIKNKRELEQIRETYRQDSAAVCKFLYWLKNTVGKKALSELSVAKKIDELRAEIPDFLDLSFPTICGYGPHAAIVHYSADEKSNIPVEAKGMILVDSGGQYKGGTTDVTRTVVLGEISEEEKLHYCKVSAGMLRLASAKFLAGCTGRNLDILARNDLWQYELDYKHGTGHGIGFVLNVHEGPQNIRWKYTPEISEKELEAGMIVSDEPGFYLSDRYGIRIENILEVQKAGHNEYGQFLNFSMLTLVPLDREALDPVYLYKEDVDRINRYHEEVYRKISPLLNPEEALWLKQVTSPL